MTNCTQCHDLGNKVSNDKCLSCHQEIKTRIDRNKGYHVSREVKGKECAQCHSEHHGLNFNMVHFDENTFDHNLTGYELTGRHKSGWSSKGQKIDCRSCHQSDFVSDAELKKKKKTFLGLGRDCADCHKDVHQKTLARDCAKCHGTDEFKPASKFNHDKTDFALLGKHKTVACIDCHLKETKNGEAFQRFSGVAFKNCSSCHKDEHNNNLGPNCKECHNETSFTDLGGLSKFNHAKTLFPLKGKHKQVTCKECHQLLTATPQNVFQDRKGVLTDQCVTCHKDVHEGSFGTNCAECHTETGFRKVQNMDEFDHSRTKFALRGKHETVDCKKCHKTASMTDPLPHDHCANCHTDYHEAQFANYGVVPDCIVCHTVEGFAESTFTIEEHSRTKFALDGAHLATPCFACHKTEEKWKFRKIGERCVDCHKDVHGGQIAEKWYPNNACEQCHQTSSWQDNKFDHSKTEFKLQGAHAKQDCNKCHKSAPDFKYGQFAGLPASCTSCHDDPHHKQFEKFGVTDCASCHGFEAWEIKKFDHDRTRFQLDGKHAKVACEGCHKPMQEGDLTFIQYNLKRFECIDCHK